MVAACRDPSSAVDLHALGTAAGNGDRLDVVKMDIEVQSSLEAAAEHVKSAHGVSEMPQEVGRNGDRRGVRPTLELLL